MKGMDLVMIIIVVLAFVLAFANMIIDDRLYIIGFSTLFLTIFGLGRLLLDSRPGDTRNIIMCFGMILLNFIITLNMRRIPALERPSFKKTSIFSILIIYAFTVYSNISSDDTHSIGFVLFISLFVAFIMYFILRELFFTYLLLWLNYFFGTSILYENKKVKCRVDKRRGTYSYKWILEDENIILKPSQEMIEKYNKNNKSGRYTKSMMIKKSLISKNLIVTEVK